MSYVDGSAVNITVLFQKVQTCHMLTAQQSTYDMFGFIELYGRKLQSVYVAVFIIVTATGNRHLIKLNLGNKVSRGVSPSSRKHN